MHKTAYVEIDGGPEIQCFCPADLAADVDNLFVMEADGVQEFGRITRVEQVDAPPPTDKRLPRLIRRATLQDQSKARELVLLNKMARESCVNKARNHKLHIRLVRVRYSFDRSVLTVLFTAEDRVDFREMIRELNAEFHTRVEMKQIGARDEAAITGGMGPCGRCLCCATWLKQFAAVNVRMIKTQSMTLNPTAITGMCGRLKCCMRYEFETYKEISSELPRLGASVHCPGGDGCVVAKNILRRKIDVRLQDNRIVAYNMSDINGFSPDKEEDGRGGDEDTGTERTESESTRET